MNFSKFANVTSMFHEIITFVIFNTQENISGTLCRHSSPLSEDHISHHKMKKSYRSSHGHHIIKLFIKEMSTISCTYF
jgi:hypothetical protein